jgi:hypothetical protein
MSYRLTTIAFAAFLLVGIANAESATRGKLEITVVDKESKAPVATRIHIKNSRGRPVRPPRSIYWKDHFVFDGTFELNLKPGQYEFELERGPEYKVRAGHFTIDRGGETSHVFEMERFVDMKSDGWWSGDLHIHRPLEQVELLMRAEDLHIGPVITWWNNRNLWNETGLPEQTLVKFDENRFYHVMAGEDEREGGSLLYFNLKEPLPISEAEREFPSPVKFLEMALRHKDVHVDVEKPFWWDAPVWLSTGMVDSIGLANNHMQRSGMLATEAWGKQRDKVSYPNPHGNGRWTQDIYYKILETGLRIPPSAGSASGVLPNPVGYNRVYVHCGPTLTWESWWEGLRAGRVVVTNGPLLRPSVNGHLPGHVFVAEVGESVKLEAALTLAVRDKVEYLEIIKNGNVVHEVALRDYAESGGKLPPVEFQSSGWMLIRAVTNNPDTFRFASTGPYYVEIGQEPRISRSAAEFFRDWVRERIERVKLDDPDQRGSVLRHHERAVEFWQDRIALATTE